MYSDVDLPPTVRETSTHHPLREFGSEWWVDIMGQQPMNRPLGHCNNITGHSDIVVILLYFQLSNCQKRE